MNNETPTLLQQANQAFREKRYQEALDQYQSLVFLNNVIEVTVAFNIELTKKRLAQVLVTEEASNFLKNLPDKIKEKAIMLEVWDEEYYLNNYPDVQLAGVDPYQHFIKDGWLECRNPSRKFNTSFYLEQVEVLQDTNPIEHYIQHGKEAGLKINDTEHRFVNFRELLDKFNSSEVFSFNTSKPIDILIPVYNGYEYLEPLFKSVYKNTTMSFRLLVANDCSPDQKVLPYLKTWAEGYSNFILIQNEDNLGFVGTVNKLAELVENHFVLLNTDTEVPEGWLERLMYPIFEMEKIATTTPFTNAGTICSFPEYIKDNLIPDGLSVDEVDEYFRKVSLSTAYIEIPTGVGFCMGVNKDVVDQIGMFDTVFGKGYGEENDFCQRAINLGYKNIHVPNLYVYHKHGGSFPSETKLKLIQQNLKTLNEKHPNYDRDVAKTVYQDKLNSIRKIIDFQIHSKDKKVVLSFDHGLGGGAAHYLEDRIKQLKDKNILSVVIEHKFNEGLFHIKLHQLDKADIIESKSILGIVEFILSQLNVDEIFVNSIVGFRDVGHVIKEILKYKKNQKIVVPLHDYYPICPSFTLLNDQGIYCGVPKDLDVCHQCLKNNNREFKNFTKDTDIIRWRGNWNELLQASDEILAFSQATIDIFSKAFDGLESKIKLIPHDISGRFAKIYDPVQAKKHRELVIGVLGGINEAKGVYVLKELAEYIEKNSLNARIVVFGDTSIKINSTVFKKTGRYKIESLPDMVKNEGVSLFFIPSIWPETFSYTTDEVMQMGYPLAVFDLGAPAERVGRYAKGIVLKNYSSASLLFNSLYDLKGL